MTGVSTSDRIIVLHRDVVDYAQMKCQEMYSTLFQEEIVKLCPLEHDRRDVLDRPKRSLTVFLIGVIIATVILPVGLGVSAVTVSSVNSAKINDLQQALLLDHNATVVLEERVKLLEEATKHLQLDFAALLKKMERYEQDFDEFKAKQLGSTFAIAHITTRLMGAKAIIQEAKRQWSSGKVHGPLLDYFNFTSPCGDDCPISAAVPNKCVLSQDRKNLYMDFSIPIINRTLQLVEADPFQLMLKEKNQTCTVVYTGPRNVILSKEKDCAFAVNVKQPVTQDLLLSPSHGCMTHSSEESSKSKHFSLDKCVPEYPLDEVNFIQIKPLHGANYIYCPQSLLVMDGRIQECPHDVFSLPMTASFKINELEYSGTQTYVNLEELNDPLFTMRANWHIQPSLNLTELKAHRLLSTEKETQEMELGHPIMWVALSMAFFIIVLVAVLCYMCIRRMIHRVVLDSAFTMEDIEGSGAAE